MFSTQATGQGKDDHVPVSGPLTVEQVKRIADLYVTENWEEEPSDFIDNATDVFTPAGLSDPVFGFIKNKVWLRLKVVNKATDTKTWYVYTHENFLQIYDVFVVRETGQVEHLESHQTNTVFKGRSIDFPQLATKLEILPNEKVTIFISYWSEGSSKVGVSLETEDSFNIVAVKQTSKNFISYGMMIILITASGVSLIILRRRVFLSYFTYVIVTLLFLMHSDGVTFQFIWPNSPGLNSSFSIIIGLALAIVPYDFARTFLRTKELHPRIDRFMVFTMILTPVIILPLAIFDPQMTKKTLMIMVLFSIFTGTFSGIIASLTRFREVRFYVLAWVFGLASAMLMNVRHLLGFEINQNLELDSIRISIVVDAVMMGLGVADRYSQNIKNQQKIDRENLLQAKLNLRLNNRLSKLEEQHRIISELAMARDTDIRNTVHDIRQPIHALRLSLQALEKRGSINEGDAVDIDGTFEYLERLISDQLNQFVGLSATSSAVQNTEQVLAFDCNKVDVSEVLDSIHKMFLADAIEKEVDFRYVPTTVQADIDPFVLMRIVSNLVANAIKYTTDGKILLGVRRNSNHVRVELHDTGIGMTREEFNFAQGPSVRLKVAENTSDGYGFGLDIVNQLTMENGLKLLMLEERDSGTSLALEIPSS